VQSLCSTVPDTYANRGTIFLATNLRLYVNDGATLLMGQIFKGQILIKLPMLRFCET
jgi:hypothetical protein